MASGVMKRKMLPRDAAAKAGLLRRDTNVPISFGDFKKHINVLMKCKRQYEWNEAINKKLNVIHPRLGLWPSRSFRIIRVEKSVIARILMWHTPLSHSFLLKKEDPPQLYCIVFLTNQLRKEMKLYIACDCCMTVKHFI